MSSVRIFLAMAEVPLLAGVPKDLHRAERLTDIGMNPEKNRPTVTGGREICGLSP
jgi:hypothetical protein